MTRSLTFHLAAPILAASMLLAVSAADAQTDQAYLQGKLSFRFVAQPNTVTSTPEVLDNAAIAAGRENGAFWSARNLRGLQNLVRSLVKPPGQGGDAALQSVTAEVIKVLGRPVLVNLLDDVTAPLTDDARSQWEACDDGHGGAWPCARNASVTDDARAQCAQTLHVAAPPRRDATWAGSMTLGQAAFNSRRAGNPLGTFVHELVHTQDRSDGEMHMFLVSGHAYHYGADGQHFWVEAVPNLASTYKEGIANAIMFTVDTEQARRMFDWFASNDVVVVEKTSLPPGTGAGQAPCWTVVTSPSPDIWLYNQLHAAGVRELHPARADSNFAYFRIRDLPPRFIVHNESIIALVFSEYARHLGLPRFINALKANDATLFRVCTSPIAQLYDTLCRAGLGGNRPFSNQIPGLVSTATPGGADGPKPYLIPLAYADFFTGYRSNTKQEYASIFENMLPHEWIDLYWDGYKSQIRLAAPIGPSMPPRPEHLTQIAIALGVNQSVFGE